MPKAYDPFKDESLIYGPPLDEDEYGPGRNPTSHVVQPAPKPAPKPKRRRYDWVLAASLLVQGVAPEAIAARLGCSTEKLWRQMNDSGRFRALVEKAVQRRRLLASFQVEAAAGVALTGAVAAPDGTSPQDAARLRELGQVAQAVPVAIELHDATAPEATALDARLRQAGRRAKPYITDKRRARLLAEIAAMPTAEELRALKRRDFSLLPRNISRMAEEAALAKRLEDEARAGQAPDSMNSAG